jgi:tetratricopeptide (TPR) repeat protein
MKSRIKSLLLYFILPAAAVVLLFKADALTGAAAVLAYIAAAMYFQRAALYQVKGRFSYSKGNIADAVKWFQKAYKTGRCKPGDEVSYAYLLLKIGNADEAEALLNSTIKKYYASEDRWYAKSNLALVLWKKGDLDAAVSMLEEVIREFKTTTVYGSLGYLLILKGDLDRALEFNLEASEYNRTNAIIQDNLGQVFYLRGEYEKAYEVYDKLIPSNPAFPEAYYNYGLVLVKRNEPGKALEAFRKASEYKLSFLSTITKEDIDKAVHELEEAGVSS